MSELVDMALGQNIKPPSLDLDVEFLDSLNVKERPSLIVKLADDQHHAQLLATLCMDNSLEFPPTNVMELHAILEKLNKIYVIDLK